MVYYAAFVSGVVARKKALLGHGLTAVILVLAATFSLAQTAQAQNVDWLTNINDTGFDPMAAGGTVDYTIRVDNNGFDPAPATTIDLSVPAGTQLLSTAGTITGCAPVPVAGPATVTCTVPAIAALGSAQVIASVQTSVAGVIDMTATVPNSSGGVNDILPGNNALTEQTTVTAGSDIGVTVTVPPTAASGSFVDFDFIAINNGPNIANSFDLAFTIPAGITNVTPPAGCVLAANVYTCAAPGPVAVGATVPFTFNGQISAAGGSTITGVGSVLNSNPGDPISSNNTDSGDIIVTAGTDLAIAKSRAPAGTLLVGDSATFKLSGSYTGDDPSGINIVDNIPANYTIDAIVAPGWDCTASVGQNVDCTLVSGSGAGANVALADITVQTTIISSGTPTNTATISSATPLDFNPANNTATDGGAIINDPVVDLRANKSGPVPQLAVVGNNYDYTISTTNVGNTGFDGTINMVDSIPAGLTVNSATLNGWSCAPALPLVGPAALTCSRTYLPGAQLGANATTPGVVLDTTVTAAGVISNGLAVSSPNANIGDTNPANDTINYDVTATGAGSSADVSAIKTASVDPIPAGDLQTYTLEVVNSGPSTSLNVQVIDDLTNLINSSVGPAEGYVGDSAVAGVAGGIGCSTVATGGTSRRLTCDIATLPVCVAGVDCPVFTVQVRPGGNGGARTNTFSATSQTTPDANLANNTASDSYTVQARADVTVTKTDSPDPVAAGQDLTYVIAAQNVSNGLSAADNVTITDTLPANLTFVSVAPSAGSCATSPAVGSVTGPGNNQVVCNLGTIANGAQRTVTLVVRPNLVTRGTQLNNTVVVSTTTTETNGANNSAAEPTDVIVPDVDILVNKTDSVDPVVLGSDTVYTITVTNTGPSASENVVMTDTLPGSIFAYRSHIVSGAGVCGTVPAVDSLGGTLSCSWPYMAAGASETVLVTMRAVAKGTIANNVTISSDEIVAGFDRLAANNQTSENTTARTRTDIEVVSKTPSANPVNLNENFDFTALVRVNVGAGLAEADNVTFTDNLPAGMVLTAAPTAVVTIGSATATACTGAAGGTSFTCDLGTVTAGSEVSITIPVEVTSVSSDPDTLTNTASVSTSSLDAVPANDTNSGQVTVGSSSIAGTVFRDFADDGAITAGDTRVSGVPVTLTGTTFDGQPVSITVNTDANGDFLFPFLAQGTYTVSRGVVGEAHLTNGSNSAGSEGGVVSSQTVISAIALPANTDAINYLFPLIPTARVGIAKAVNGVVTTAADGSFTAPFRLTVENFSLETLNNMVVTDPLQGAAPLFGTYQALGLPATDPMTAGSYTIVTAPAGTCGGLVAGFNGAANQTVATGFSLASGATCNIDFTMRVQPTAPLPAVQPSGDRYENQATVTGEGALSGQTSATNPELSDLSDNGADPDPSGNDVATDAGEDDVTPVGPSIAPAIALIKTADISALSNPPVAGEVITYSFAVTNTGTQILTNVSLTESLAGAVISGGPIASLAPGVTDNTTFTATYALTQTDVNAGQVQNQATITGTDPYGGTVNDLSGTTNVDDIALVTALAPAPSIALVKTADASALQSPPQAGDVMSYAFAITNSGNVTLTNVTLTDALPGIAISGGPIASLAPGATDATTYTATYALTQADIDAGEVQNQATATGTPPSGPDVSDLSGATAGDDQPTVTALANAPSIALIKTADTSALSMPGQVGELITYNFEITNTGNVTLTNVLLNDSLPGIVVNGGPIASLAPGATDSTTYTATYALTAADVALRRVTNQATATGSPPTGAGVSDASGSRNSDDDPTVTMIGPITAIAGLDMVKTTPSDVVKRGDVVPYSIVITNDNSFQIAGTDIVDTLPDRFVYVAGSANINGAPATVTTSGQTVTWANVTIPATSTTTLTLSARILSGVRAGEHVNTVRLIDQVSGIDLTSPAAASVRILPEAIFDCGEVVGKVFNDRNGNGYQDPSTVPMHPNGITDQTYYGGKGKAAPAPEDTAEAGIPGVRLATVDGLLVTTDEHGRFSVPCAMLPADRGSNFLLKLDTRTLPSGFHVTTENPRVVRMTPGMMSEVNFGASVGRLIRVDLGNAAFTQDGRPTAELTQGLQQLATALVDAPGAVRLAYHLPANASAHDATRARARMRLVEAELKDAWQQVGHGRLLIEPFIARAAE